MADPRSDVSIDDVISSLTKTPLPEGYAEDIGVQDPRQLGDPQADIDALLSQLTPRREARGVQRAPSAGTRQGTFAKDLPPEAIALLDTIAGPESSGAYNVRYGGAKGPQFFNDYSQHPHIQERINSGPYAGQTSGAAGRYQFTHPTWVKVARQLGLTDFTPRSQDLGAWHLAQQTYAENTGRNLLSDLKTKDPRVLGSVSKALSGQWASLAGGAQPTLSTSGFANNFMRNLQGGPQPGGAQPIQPANTYPLKLPNGGTLHVPVGVSEEEALQQAKAAGIPMEASRQIKLPNGGTLTAPAGVSDEEAIRTAAQHIPDLQQYVKGPTQGKDRNILSAMAGNLVGGAEQFGGSFLKGYSETGLPGAETAKEYAGKMLPDAEKRITEIPEEEIAAAEKEGLIPGLAKKAEAKFLLPAAHMVGRYGAEMIPAGRALTVGKLVAEHMASLGDITKRAEDTGTAVEGWKAHAAAGISSILANVGIPHVLANGVISKALGGASEQALLKAFQRGGLQEANQLLGTRVGALIKDIPIGLGTATAAGFGTMAGTEAAQRAALGQPMQTPAELGESLESAAWLSPMALPGAVKARGERGKYVDYLQKQKELKEAYEQQQQEQQQETPPPPLKPKEQPDKEFPHLTVEQADLLREVRKQQEAPTPEPPVGEAAKTEEPKGPVSATYNVDTDVGSFPAEVMRHPDGNVSIDSGEGPFEYSAKQAEGKTDADILAQHFSEAGFKSAAPAGEAPKEPPKTEEVKAEEPPAPPPAPEVQVPPVTFTAPEVPKTKEEIGTNIEALTKQAEEFQKANDFDNYNAAMQSIGQHETELRRIGAEEMAAQPKAPEAPAVTPAAEPHFAESILGLKPVKSKLSLYQKLLQHDINTPEGREAVTDLLHKTSVKIEPEKLVALQKRMEELDAQQITEAGAPDGRGGAQPSVREEGRDQAVSGEGVEPSRQGEQAAEVETPKEEIAPAKEEEPVAETEHPLIAEIDKLNTQLGPVQAAIVDLNAQRKAAQEAGDKEGVSAATAKIQKLESITRAVKDQIKRHNETMQAERDVEAEKTAAQAREEAKRKVEEQGGYEEDLDAPLYSKTEEPVENPHTAETLQEDLNKRYGRNAPRVEVSTREAEGVEADVKGFYDPTSKRIVLIADNIGRNEDVHGLMRHEVAVHARRLGRTDAEFQAILDRLQKLKEAGDANVLKAYDRVPENTHPDKVHEEALAYLSQHAPNLGVVKQFMSWLRRVAHKYTGHAGWLRADDFGPMADAVLRAKPKELASREGERLYARRKSQEEKQLEQSDLVKSEPSDSVKAAKGFATAVKNTAKAIFSSEYREDLISEAGRKMVARSHGIAKALEPYETFSDWGGVRADINQNQLDNMSHILSNMWKMGGLDISEGGLMKITNDPKHALYNWGQAVRKLPISEKSAFSIMRALIGEAWEKEAAQRRTKAKDLEDYAKTLLTAARTASGAQRDKYRRMGEQLHKEAKKLAKDAGTAPFEGMERKVSQADIDAAHSLMRRHSEVKAWVEQGHQIHRNAVDFMLKTGTIDAETAKDWKSRPYIPLFKAMEDLAASGEGSMKFVGASAKGLSTRAKKGTGHTEAVNVMENMYKSLTQLYVSSAINHTRMRTIDQLRALGQATRTNEHAKDAILVKRGGKQEYWKVSDPAVFEALKESPVLQNAFLDMMAAPAGMVRSALIKHPGYWAKSITREPLTANFTSRTGFVSPHQVLGHVVRNLLGGSAAVKDIERYGYSGVLESQLDPARFSQAVKGLSGMDRIKNFWNKTHTAFDSATRGAVYDAAIAEGKKRGLAGEKLQDFAAMKASEFANFATRGTSEIIHEMGRHTPFMRAALNSLDNLYRNATGSHLNYREKQQARSLFRARAAAMTYMSAVYALAMINDPDYLNAPASDWTMNFFGPGMKKDKWTPINAGFETAVLFKAFPELLVRLYTGSLEPQDAGRIAQDLVQEKVMPPMIPMFPQIFIKLGLGYDINLGREMESASAQQLAPELRDMNASAFAKLVAKKLDTGKYGISPDKLENIGRSVMGGIYDMGLTLADAVIAHTDPDLLYDKNEVEKYPILKNVEIEKKVPKNVAKAPVFYDATKEAEQIVDSVNKASARASKEDLDKLLKDPEKMAMYKISDVLRDYRDRIAGIRNAVEAMGNSDLPTSEKEKRAMEARKLIHTLETDAAVYAQKFLRDKR